MRPPGQPQTLSLRDAIAAARELHAVLLARRRVEWQHAAGQIAEAAGTTLEELRGHRDRDAGKTEVRRLIAHYLHGQGASLPEIARLLGYRDHTTPLYLLKREPRRARPVEIAS